MDKILNPKEFPYLGPLTTSLTFSGLSSLKLTPENQWLEDEISYSEGLFPGAFAVSFRVPGTFWKIDSTHKGLGIQGISHQVG